MDYETWLSTHPLQQVAFLAGPYGLTRMSFPGDDDSPAKVFYLFHDEHTRQDRPCRQKAALPIDEFFQQLLTSTPYVIDFILETPEVGHRDDLVTQTALGQLRARFRHCFDRRSRAHGECEIDHPRRVRFHFNDWRFNWPAFNEGLRQFRQWHLFWQKSLEEPDNPTWQHFMRGSFQKLLPLNKTLNEWDAFLRERFKVNKQLAQCSARVRRVIEDWMAAELREPEVTEPLQRLQQWFEDSSEATAVDFSEPWGVGHGLFVVYMDAYTVARMYRTFRKSADEFSEDMRNVFVYAGGIHALNYEKLLKLLGCVVDVKTTNHHAVGRDQHVHCVSTRRIVPWMLLNTDTEDESTNPAKRSRRAKRR